MIKYLYYSIRNILYYNKHRQINRVKWLQFTRSNDINDTKLLLTNYMLATVGLKVSNGNKNIVPWYIPLSQVQKQWISLANNEGYYVELT